MSRFAAKPVTTAVAAGSAFVHEDKFLTASFPALWDYLTQTKYDDGKERQTSTLLLFCESGLFKVCLSDRENERSAWSGGESVEEAIMRLEEALANGRVEWRRKQGPGAPAKVRK